ncbi:MAG: hypothetical protein AB7Q37_15660 [Pyrinomonadaceae bacterium]
MIATADEIIEPDIKLPPAAKKRVASLILRDSAAAELPPLLDDELVMSAEYIFLELDRPEA